MKRKIALPVVIVVAVVAAIAVFWWVRHDRDEPVTQLVAYGNVEIRQVELAFNAAERIDEMQVREGERVHKGQPLAMLDARSLSQNVDQRAAQMAAQEQVVARLVAGSRPQEIRKARAEVEAAQVAADNAERTYARIKALVARQFVAEQQANDARAAADGAQAQLKAARETLQLAQLGARKEDIAAARATLEANRAALAIARQQLADAVLHAPADGVIRTRILEPGDMASPQKPVYTLALTDPVWVRAYVPGPQLGKLHPGMRAVVTTDSYPDKRYQAWVGYLSPTAEFTPKSVETTEVRTSLVYQMRVFVCDPRNELRLGMPATVTIPFDQPADSGAAAQPCPQS